MVFYTKEEKQNENSYVGKYNNLLLLDMYDESMEILQIVDSNFTFQNLITRNERLDLYNDKPLIEDASKDKFDSLKIFKTSSKQKPSDQEMNWNDYQNLDVIYKWMDNLEYNNPSLCSVIPIGITIEGRTMKMLKISNSDVKNAPVWLDAGIHAREWIAPAVNTFIADYIVQNFNTLPGCFTNKDWYFLPVANPDGYDYSHKVERMWRKNRALYGGEIAGVDLNRNFSFGWGGRHSSTDPSSPFFRGREPFSEPETAAMKDILMNSGINFKVYVTLHSFGQVIVFPFGYRDELCPDYVRLLQGATAMSKAIYRSTGNIYKVGISRDVMYGASGTSTDWSYGTAKIPFCYLIELRSKQHKFELPKEEIKENCKEILHCIQALMDFVDNNPINSDISSINSVTMAPPCVKALCGKTQVWEVKLNSEKQRCFIKTLDTVGAVNIWKEERSSMDIMVEGPKSAQVAELLYERCIPFAIAIGDVGPMLDREGGRPKSRKCVTGSKIPMDWKSYHRLNVIYEFMECLAAECPGLCTVCTIGRSVEGRAIKMLKISNGRCNNSGVWMDAAIHPREWISTAVLTYVADQLVRTFDQQPEFITNKDWYIVPVVNPDGYEYTHTHDRMWRKNRARYGECYGVDLNRNFSYGWGERDEEGSSDDPANIFYRGPEPFSEPETAAIRQAICGSGTKFKAFLSFHSYGEVIIFPWGYTGDPCPHYVQMLEAGTAMAKAIQQASGHIYKVGSTKDLMYYAAGTSTDWSYAVANIPFSYMVELRGKRHRFLLPKEEIVCTSIEVLCGVTKLMEYVDKRSRVTSAPSAETCRSPSCQSPSCQSPSCQSPSYACKIPRTPSWVNARCHSCRSSRSCCKSGHSSSCSRSHSRQSCKAQKCESSHSKCRLSPPKSCNFTE